MKFSEATMGCIGFDGVFWVWDRTIGFDGVFWAWARTQWRVVGGSSFLTNYEYVFILVKLSFLLSPTSKLNLILFATMCVFFVLTTSPRSKPTTSFVTICFFWYSLPLLEGSQPHPL